MVLGWYFSILDKIIQKTYTTSIYKQLHLITYMSQQQVRITKNQQIQIILDDLQKKFQLTSDAELFKMALASFYDQYKKENNLRFKQSLEIASKKLGKYGDKLLQQKGLKRENLTDEELINLAGNDY